MSAQSFRAHLEQSTYVCQSTSCTKNTKKDPTQFKHGPQLSLLFSPLKGMSWQSSWPLLFFSCFVRASSGARPCSPTCRPCGALPPSGHRCYSPSSPSSDPASPPQVSTGRHGLPCSAPKPHVAAQKHGVGICRGLFVRLFVDVLMLSPT